MRRQLPDPALLAGGLLLAGALMLTGCAGPVAGTAAIPAGGGPASATPTTSSDSSGPSTTRPLSTVDDSSVPATPEPTGTEDPDVSGPGQGPSDIAMFGETYVWTDGLEVTVSPGEVFTPSPYASAEPANAYLVFTVSIVNNTGAPYDPLAFLATAQSAGAESDQVFDSDNQLTIPPSTTLLDGRESTFTIGFGVVDPADVVLEVTPGFDYDPALFATEGAMDRADSTPDSPSDMTESGPAAFGQTFGWTNGLEVMVAAGSEFTPSSTASADPAAAYLSFTVTITNRTGDLYEPLFFTATAQSGKTEAKQVFDSAAGLGVAPSTSILDGRQAVFQIGFGVADPADVVIQISPGFDYDSANFTS